MSASDDDIPEQYPPPGDDSTPRGWADIITGLAIPPWGKALLIATCIFMAFGSGLVAPIGDVYTELEQREAARQERQVERQEAFIERLAENNSERAALNDTLEAALRRAHRTSERLRSDLYFYRQRSAILENRVRQLEEYIALEGLPALPSFLSPSTKEHYELSFSEPTANARHEAFPPDLSSLDGLRGESDAGLGAELPDLDKVPPAPPDTSIE